MNVPFISIIVPIYKVEKYLNRCIDSILSQTFTDFEVLLIDDGSPDRCGAICEQYAEKDHRVRVFHKENGGVSTARNMGIDNSIGKYLCFIDSDDYVENSYLQNFIDALEPDTDLVLQSFWRHYEEKQAVKTTILPAQTLTGGYRLVQWLEDAKDVHNGFLWHRLFRADYIRNNHIRFQQGISFAEDGCFFIQYLKGLNKFKMTSQLGYHYMIRQGSLTSAGKKVPLSLHDKVIRGYITSMLDLDVPEYDKVAYECFVHRYAWRLSESWFLEKAFSNSALRKDAFSMLNQLIREFHLDKVEEAPLSLYILVRLVKMEDSKARNFMLKRLLFYRSYEKKIRYYLKG